MLLNLKLMNKQKNIDVALWDDELIWDDALIWDDEKGGIPALVNNEINGDNENG